MRPNFVVIGPGRSGTTWMYRALSLHPDIGVSTAKETLYFERYYAKGDDWYARFFRHCDGKRAVGEVSNTYIFCAGAAERIHRYDPKMRIISSLRNPVDRAFSHYLFLVRNGQVRGRFESVIGQRPDLLTRGLYSEHLSHYLRWFSREQMLLLVFEHLQADPHGFARRIYHFLGVDPAFTTERLAEKVYGAERPRNRILARTAKLAAQGIRAAGFPDVLTVAKGSFIVKVLFKRYSEADYPRLGDETRRRLEHYFRADVDKTSELVGEDLSKVWF